MAHDLVIRGGIVYDGKGGDPIDADVAIDDKTIVAVGQVSGRGTEEIDASNRVVTPGFIDLHTHYDAQVAWDSSISPSSSHGVTSALLGNCSVTFAPCKPADRAFLANMMETVEDIPSKIILEAMPWDWESYGEYLDSIERRSPAINVAGLVGHAAIRFHVLGERAISKTRDDEPEVSDAELAEMVALAGASIRGGAVGLSLNRLAEHVLPDKRPIPGTWAPHSEIVAMARAVQREGGFVQCVPVVSDTDDDHELFRAITQDAGARLIFTSLIEQYDRFDGAIDQLRADGSDITGLTLPRPIGFVAGINTVLPFRNPVWREFRRLDLDEKLTFLANSERRADLVKGAAADEEFNRMAKRMFWLGDGDDPQYLRRDSLADEAREMNQDPIDLFLDRSLESRGEALFHWPFANINQTGVLEHLNREWVIPSLGDAGAHARQISDVGFSTFYLSHWVRKKRAIPMAAAVQKLTRGAAKALGLRDRGVITEGMRADLNVIDFDRLGERQPRLVQDLPLGGERLVQGAVGFDATICNGVIINRHDELTGKAGGELLRSQ